MVGIDEAAQRRHLASAGGECGVVGGCPAAREVGPASLEDPESHHVLQHPPGALDATLVGDVQGQRLGAEALALNDQVPELM